MTDQEQSCKPCPEGQIEKDGKCVMPKVNFTTFVMSLNTAALFHLGELNDPATGKSNKDLVLAKHTIDTLEVLEKKTTGNLTEKEKNLIDNILCDLKLRFVKAKE